MQRDEIIGMLERQLRDKDAQIAQLKNELFGWQHTSVKHTVMGTTAPAMVLAFGNVGYIVPIDLAKRVSLYESALRRISNGHSENPADEAGDALLNAQKA
mgnify:CR=1 FL=1